MKKNYSIISITILLFLQNLSLAQAPSIQWQKTLGGSKADQGAQIRNTPDGGYILIGNTYSNDFDVTGNHGAGDYWVVKLSATGNIDWQKTYGGTGYDYGYDIRTTTDGGYILAGRSQSNDIDVSGNHGGDDAWIVKIDMAGNIQWQKSLGGSGSDFATCIQQTSDNGYVVACTTTSNNGDVSGFHGTCCHDYWIVKLTPAGNIEWKQILGGTDQDEPNSIQQTTDGGYVVAGYSSSNDGDVTGNHGLGDFWVVKLNSIGTLLWQKSFGGTGEDQGSSIYQTNDGGYIVAGYSASNDGDVSGNHGLGDFWVVKLTSTGTLVWERSLGGNGDDSGNSIQQTIDGGYIVAGSSPSNDCNVPFNKGLNDYWTVKLSATGNPQWEKALGGSSDDFGYSVQQTTDGGYILAGISLSNDGDVSGNHGFSDIWIAKITSCIPTKWYADVDADGFGNPTDSILFCTQPCGYVSNSFDCNDRDPNIGTSIQYYVDADHDGFGSSVTAMLCSSTAPLGYSTNNNDCNDNDANIHPGATEICNGIDDDCDGLIDEGVQLTFYRDADADGYGNKEVSILACKAPAGYVNNSADCNDKNNAIHPGAVEILNGIDDNCNGKIDEGICNLSVSTGNDLHTSFGYPPEQCKTKTAVITGGKAPFTYKWSVSHSLISNIIKITGDETITGTNTSTISFCLVDTAEVCVKVTDANGCVAKDCAIIFAEDVRCFVGNSKTQRVVLCHNGSNICVELSAIPAHLSHGDYVGSCKLKPLKREGDPSLEESLIPGLTIIPNPNNGNFNVNFNLANTNENDREIQIIDMNGQVIKQLKSNAQPMVNFSLKQSGIYFIQIITNKKVITKKVIVIR